MSCTPLPKAAKPVWAKQLTRLSGFVVYVKFQFVYLTIGREVPLRLSFFPDGSGTPIPVFKLVKDLGVQADNMFSPSAQRTEAANKARRLIVMIRCHPMSLEIGFHPFIRGLNASAPRIW